MDIIFTHQLTHQRSIAYNETKARVAWRKDYAWFPKEQRCVYMESDRIYNEVIDKYGRDMFKPYAIERHVTRRIYKSDEEQEKNAITFVDFSYMRDLPRQETTSQTYGRYKPYVLKCVD